MFLTKGVKFHMPQKRFRTSLLATIIGGILAGVLTAYAVVALDDTDTTKWGIDRHAKESLLWALLLAGILLAAGIGVGTGYFTRRK